MASTWSRKNRRDLRRRPGLVGCAVIVVAPVVAGFGIGPPSEASTRLCNPTPIAAAADGSLAPYPSSVVVSGIPGAVVDVNVTVSGLTTGPDTAGGHWTEDLDILLSAPDGSNAVLMSDAGGENINPSGPLVGVDLTFDDEASAGLPPDSLIREGTYQPVDDDDDFDDFLPRRFDLWPSPAPPTAQVASLSVLDGVDPNGVWNLWAVDDNVHQRAESLTGGWCLDITIRPRMAAPADIDGDGDTDVAVFRPSNGYWFMHAGPMWQFGTTGDIPVPADYDGDEDADVAMFRPSNGYWFVLGGTATQFGTGGDIPVPGDYDGDGAIDAAVFRPTDGYWFVDGGPATPFGSSGDVPLPLPDAVRRFSFPPL